MRRRTDLIRQHPYLLSTALAGDPPGSAQSHHAAIRVLQQVIARGQASGDFDDALAASRLAEAIVGIARTAAEQVAADRLTAADAAPMITESALQLCGVGPQTRGG